MYQYKNRGVAPASAQDALGVAASDGMAFGKSGEPEHREIDAWRLTGNDRRQRLTQRRAELEPVAGKPRRDVQTADAVDRSEHGLPVRSDVI